MSFSSIPKGLRLEVAERDNGRCRYCGMLQYGQGTLFHVDHVTPRNSGGATSLDNLATQCPNCSLHKSDKVTAVDPLTRSLVPLFHPLKDQWAEHFALMFDGTCSGLTPIGRATVEALAMNNPLPLSARAIQLMLGVLEPSQS